MDILISFIEKTSNMDLFEHMISFFSVFIGAWFAYKFSCYQDNNREKKYDIEKYVILANSIVYISSNLLSFKKHFFTLNKIETIEQIRDISKKFYTPDINFPIEIKDYVFMCKYNENFFYQLAQFKSHIDKLNRFFTNTNLFTDTSYELESLNISVDYILNSYNSLYSNFLSLINATINYCHFFMKALNKCYARYLNINYLENIEKNFAINQEYVDIMPKMTENDVIREKEFDKYWCGYPNFFCWCCFQFRKIKHFFKFLRIFFTIPKCNL